MKPTHQGVTRVLKQIGLHTFDGSSGFVVKKHRESILVRYQADATPELYLSRMDLMYEALTLAGYAARMTIHKSKPVVLVTARKTPPPKSGGRSVTYTDAQIVDAVRDGATTADSLLAALGAQHKSNLMRRLRILEQIGLLTLVRENGRYEPYIITLKED